MKNVIDLRVIRLLKQNSDFIETTWRETEEELADALATDISRLNGRQLRQLRQLRDGVLSLKMMRLILSPEGKRRISQKLDELGRELTPEEVAELFPSPTVSFI